MIKKFDPSQLNMDEQKTADQKDEKPWWEVEDEEDDQEKAVGIDEVYQEIQLASSRLMEAATAVVIETAGMLNMYRTTCSMKSS